MNISFFKRDIVEFAVTTLTNATSFFTSAFVLCFCMNIGGSLYFLASPVGLFGSRIRRFFFCIFFALAIRCRRCGKESNVAVIVIRSSGPQNNID